MRATWILADPHGGADESADRALIAFLERARAERADLLILGDLFLGWIALPKFFTPFQREVIAQLSGLRAGGATVDFVAGNRDYLVEQLAGTTFDRVYGGEELIPLGGIRTLVTHGDRINARDHAYRLWHRLSRSAPASRLLASLPGAAGRALARKTEHALRDTNQSYKSGDLPISALLELGRRAQRKGAARALVGHFHHDRVLDVPGGSPVTVAPGFVDHQRFLVVDPATGALTSTVVR